MIRDAVAESSILYDQPRSNVWVLAIFGLFCVAVPVRAQDSPVPAEESQGGGPAAAEDRGEGHREDHGHDSGSHGHSIEIGLAPGLVFLPSDDSLAFGLHLHVVAAVPDTRWGVGFGVERLFDAHGHTTFSWVVQLRIVAGWSLIVAPGVTLEDSDWTVPLESVHIETTYEFMFDAFHLGPSLEFAADPEEVHITLGLHFALGV